MTSARFPPPIPPLDVVALLHRYGLRAHKRLGQNFLQDPGALQKIVAAAQIQPTDDVLEIGPGLGSLTRYLAAAAKRVFAIELDERLFPPLEATIAPYHNIQLIHGDILDLDIGGLIQQPGYLVVANLPYYITSAAIRRLLENDPKPRRIVLTIQKEVAARICAAPGDMSLLALSVQVYGQPRVVAHIPSSAFFPAPQVDSAVVKIDIYDSSLVAPPLLETFFQLIRAGFSQKRKTLRNALTAGLRRPASEIESLLRAAGIEPQRRAETLSLEEWGKLSQLFLASDYRSSD